MASKGAFHLCCVIQIQHENVELHAFDNVDFNGLKAKVFKHRKHEETDYLNMLLGKEIRDVIQREIMLREQQAAAAKMVRVCWFMLMFFGN